MFLLSSDDHQWAQQHLPTTRREIWVPAPPSACPARRTLRRLRAYRTAIVLRDIEGPPTRDAAEIAGIGQAAFKSRLHEARRKLRAALGDKALLSGA